MGFPRVVIIGGGFAGLNAAKELKKADVNLLLLDKANHHLFQPLLYQVATAALSPGEIALPIREILAKNANTTVLMADIVKIDKQKQEVIAANGDTYPFDYLILAPGATHSYFGKPEWEPLAPGLKTLEDALHIRERILLSYERAERCDSISQAARFLRFIIVGGGPTGVEMAGAIAEIARKSLYKNFRRIKPEHTKIYLIEGTDCVLPTYPKSLCVKAKKALEKLGVEVILNTRVTNVTSEGVWLGEKFLESPNIIWAAGNEAAPLLKTLGVPLDRSGRVIVQKDLTIPGHSNIFVIGDAASYTDETGKNLMGVAPVAIQEGRYVARLISKRIDPNDRPAFKYFDKGMIATIGRAKAIGVVGKIKLSGLIAWMAWGFIHIMYLISFPNKLQVFIEWCFLYLANERRIRLITRSISDDEDPLYRVQTIPKNAYLIKDSNNTKS